MLEHLKILGVIPARYASSRFPGKPLVDIHGKTMIRRVYEQAKQCKLLYDVVVATDHAEIFKEVESFGGKACYTSAEHSNGTERCAEVAQQYDVDVIINIQGDEPFIQPEQIDTLARCFESPYTNIATLIKKHELNDELRNPARVKVTVTQKLEALYFSRSVIPFQRATSNPQPVTFYKHIGIYGYRKSTLLELVELEPTMLELTESLEQLRWLENAYNIQCALTKHESLAVDTPEDLEEILKRSD